MVDEKEQLWVNKEENRYTFRDKANGKRWFCSKEYMHAMVYGHTRFLYLNRYFPRPWHRIRKDELKNDTAKQV